MAAELISPILAMVIAAYQGLVTTFGSPTVLLAIAAALVVIALTELCVRGNSGVATEAN